MPLDHQKGVQPANAVSALHRHVASLNASHRHHAASDVLAAALAEWPDLALVSSFGAESVALLHLASMVSRDLPVIFIDTEMLFTETLVYQQEVAERLALRNVRIIRADNISAADPQSDLHQRDPASCCALRKTTPLNAALRDFNGWITGRKRFQSGTRAALDLFEVETPLDAPARIKVNPLAHWRAEDVAQYIDENRLPRHPLVAKGYPSIGCAPCTSAVQAGEETRAGRWRNTDKDECGIHFANGKITRQGALT